MRLLPLCGLTCLTTATIFNHGLCFLVTSNTTQESHHPLRDVEMYDVWLQCTSFFLYLFNMCFYFDNFENIQITSQHWGRHRPLLPQVCKVLLWKWVSQLFLTNLINKQKCFQRKFMKWQQTAIIFHSKKKWKWELLSCVCLSATPWTVARKAPLSLEFSRPEHWSGLPFLSPGDLPNTVIEPRSPELQADSSLSTLT